MWKKILAVFFLFYLFALLQSSFLIHFNVYGAFPNLVFILFFIIVFSLGKQASLQVIFLSLTAGILLDFLSFTYLGPSIITLLFLGFLLKGVQSALKNTEETGPFIYFLPLFIIFFLAYRLLLAEYAYFFEFGKIMTVSGIETIFSVMYNSIVASACFFIYKWQKSTRLKI